MIVTVCADKGSPGVSTTATLLSLVWPGSRLLLEADPSGGDAALRLRTPAGGLLARSPTLRGLCVDIRGAVPSEALSDYAQPTSIGLPVISAADMRSEDLALVAGQWPAVARAASSWTGTVVADVGRLQPDNPAGALAAASAVVLLVGRATPTGLFHLRERAASLVARLGQGLYGRSPLAVAVICPNREHQASLDEARSLLASEPATSGVPVVGWIAHDPRAVTDLDAGAVTARLARSDLVATARDLAGALLADWPALTASLESTDDAADGRGETNRVGAPVSAAGDGARAEPGDPAADETPEQVLPPRAEPRPAATSTGRPAPVGPAVGSPSMTSRGWS